MMELPPKAASIEQAARSASLVAEAHCSCLGAMDFEDAIWAAHDRPKATLTKGAHILDGWGQRLIRETSLSVQMQI